MSKGRRSRFVEHGGTWVLVQFPLLVLAYLLPQWFGHVAVVGLGHPLQALGAVLTAGGALLAASGFVTLGRYLTPFPRPPAKSALRQTGAYRLVRHPIYAGLIAASAGWSLLWLSWVGIGFTAMLGLFFDRKATFEEGMLREKFADYGRYQLRTRKLIPWLY